jgi:iron complex outermembrane receptor protein
MKKVFKGFILSGLLVCSIAKLSAQDTINIKEVEVSSARTKVKFNQAARNVVVISKQEIESSPAKTLNELLEYSSGVDIRQRGQNGVQADISLRGSSFEQVLVLLNGVKMTDPQTGHHSLNLPINLLDIERIEIIKGGASRIFGPGAFAGAINIITKNPEQSQGKIQTLIGQYGLQQIAGSATLVAKDHSHTISISDQKSDGFIRNTDFTQKTIFWQSELEILKSNWTINLGQNEKAFGAQNFYTSTYPFQFEETKTQFASISGEVKKGKLTVQPKGYFRRHNDRFELYRESNDFYTRTAQGRFVNNLGDTSVSWYKGPNYNQTDVYGAELNFQYKSKLGQTSFGVDYRREELLSNNLGEDSDSIKVENEAETAYYTKEAFRENRSVYLEHNYVGKKLFASIGGMYNLNSDFDEEWFWGGDLSYQIGSNFRPFVSINKSFRLPTYTDLYYSLGGAQGSIDLKPEEAINYEAGLKYFNEGGSGTISFFRRDGKNLIDWIRYTDSTTTQAANLTEVIINGVELEYILQPSSYLKDIPVLNQVRFSYAYLFSEDESTNFESNYVLDFLSHKADLLLQLKIMDQLFIDWNLSYQERKGEYVNTKGDEIAFKSILLTDIKISAQKEDLTLFLQASNLFDEEYFDIGNVANPGRWISIGMNYKFNFKKK